MLPHDNYYRHRPDLSDEERDAINFDHPESLETELMVEHLKVSLISVILPPFLISCLSLINSVPLSFASSRLVLTSLSWGGAGAKTTVH